ELAGAIGAPVGTTLRARELFVGNEHNLGIVGSLSHQVAAEVVGDADVLVAFGAALNSYTTAEGAFVTDKRVIQVDIETKALNKHQTVDLPIHGDSATVARELLTLFHELELPPSGYASTKLARRLSYVTSEERKAATQIGFVDMRE